jgi:glyoxylase I family protein
VKLRGVHHVSLNVDDLEAAERFYGEVLGLEKLPRPDFGFPGLWYEAGGQQIHLMKVERHLAPEGQHFAFRVEDLDAALEHLRGRGVETGRTFDVPGAGRQSFLRDPAGNIIELNQPKG